MLEEHKVEDKTEQIREQKHSGEIKQNVEFILNTKKEHPTLSKKELENIKNYKYAYTIYQVCPS
jgi:rubrerythrin